ncbi:hypothetical protein ABMA28_001379 [Loxostege sticticalis]|uniref:FLYWCH-type domain-containing protein n=1 Tax=Loxostege sticticalis TaxID=481309 RepID=A0ABD0T1G6_LOXSC
MTPTILSRKTHTTHTQEDYYTDVLMEPIVVKSLRKLINLCSSELESKRRKRKKKLSREERLAKKRELERKRYAQIRQDPEKFAEYKARNRQKYLQYKANGRIKHISEMSELEKSRTKRKQTREERLEKKRLAQRRRLEMIRSDPQLYEELKAKDRERYKKLKEEKKILPLKEMTSLRRMIQRKRNRENFKRQNVVENEQTREERLEQKRLAQRRRLEMIRSDPQLYEELKNNKKFFMYKGYTYTFGFRSKFSQRWRCTNTHSCRAYIMVTHDDQFLQAVGNHNHPPPSYHITNDGKYVRL